MSRPIQFDNHPFRFLLYLEWVLIIIATLTEVLPTHVHEFSRTKTFPEVTICAQIIFGLMGLRLPVSNKTSKILYTLFEIFLILIAGFFGGRTARLFPCLYLILVTRSCLIFQFTGRLIITSLSFVLFLFTLGKRFEHLPLSPLAQEKLQFFPLNLALVFGLSLVFILQLMNTLITERQSRESLALANNKLRQYALQIENQATLEERNRIAREIHDSLGHSLTALNLQLETALKLSSTNPNKAIEFLARAKELGSKALQDVRQSVSTMRSHPLQGQTLVQAVSALAEDFHRSNGILLNCKINIDCLLPNEVNTAVYRIIQESLTNISKYANASAVDLELTTTPRFLQLIIQDNGRGFNLKQNTTGFGLQSMRDRTLALGGQFQIHSVPGSGCQITVNIPLSRLIL